MIISIASLPAVKAEAAVPDTVSYAASKAKKKGIKAPSPNYTGLASSGGNKYCFKNGKICVGFVKTDAGYMYFDPKTYAMKTGFMYSKGLYYFGSNGIMLSNGMYDIDNTKYYFGADGRATTYPVAGQNTILIPNVVEYGLTSGITKNSTRKEKDLYQEMVNNGIFMVYSDHIKTTDKIVSDMEDLGYKVELDDVTKDGYQIYTYQYDLYKNNAYVGVMQIMYDFNAPSYTVGIMG